MKKRLSQIMAIMLVGVALFIVAAYTSFYLSRINSSCSAYTSLEADVICASKMDWASADIVSYVRWKDDSDSERIYIRKFIGDVVEYSFYKGKLRRVIINSMGYTEIINFTSYGEKLASSPDKVRITSYINDAVIARAKAQKLFPGMVVP